MGELRMDLKMQRCDHGRGTRVGRGFILAMALSLLGVWLAVFAPIQVLLAQQMEILAPNSKESALGMVMGIGSAIALVAQPVIGFLSDRTRSCSAAVTRGTFSALSSARWHFTCWASKRPGRASSFIGPWYKWAPAGCCVQSPLQYRTACQLSNGPLSAPGMA